MRPEFHVIIQLNDKYGINVAAVALEEFLMIEKVLASDISFNIIYIMIAKLLAAGMDLGFRFNKTRLWWSS